MRKNSRRQDRNPVCGRTDQPLFSLYAVIAFSIAVSTFERFFSIMEAKSFLPA
jgi:hypothetical protein